MGKRCPAVCLIMSPFAAAPARYSPAMGSTVHAMHSKIETLEGTTPSAALATSARGLPSRRLSVAPMMDWT